MSEKENKKVKPNSDSDSCAGANAASGVDMTLATTDPLSEIVWSLEKGLSLKCADKNNSLFRNVGPSYCMVLSPPQSVIYCNSITDKPINDNFLKSTAMACVKPDYKADEKSSTGKVEPKPIIMEQNPSPGRPSIEFGTGKKAVGIGKDDDLHVAFAPIIEYKGSCASRTNLTSSSRDPLEKTEFCAENDLRNIDTEPDCAATYGVTVCKCKKRRNYQQQQLIIGSKRAENNVEETSGSKSYIKQESSFKNWISSMVKGISQSMQHDSNSLSLRIANPGRYDAGSSQPNIEPLHFFNSQETSKINQVENESCSNLDLSKEEMASNSSSTRQNTNNTNNVSERKESENIGHRRDNLGSLWISRFAPKSTAPLFNDRSSSPGITNSEQMALMVARRSVSSEHSMPTNKVECTSQVNMFCLFCGTRGHQLSDCSAVEESELEDLQKNANPYEDLENFAFMCIKCFQLNHWAISCSKLPSGNNVIPSNEGSARPQTDAADRILSGSTIHDRTDHKTDQNVNLKRKSNDIIAVEIECNASSKKYCGSSSKENKFKDKPIITSPSRHVPERIFDAVESEIFMWL
ncbi:hypothetical protein P8452_03550 [Trifolium repens]|nr:hypothetical protein P8452_03550 [Trifolium repens]